MAIAERLVGSDATLFRGTVGASPVTTGAMVQNSIYRIATISGVAVFPAGFEVGDYFLGNGSTLSAGNSAYLVTSSEQVDVSEFSFDISAPEIEVTTLSDDATKFRKGKTDVSGSISGINFISEMKKAGSFLNRFMKTVVTTVSGAAVSPISSTNLVGVFYLQKDITTSGETQAVMIVEVETFGYRLGAAVADAQTWESGLRLTGNDPIVFFRANT